MMMVKNIQTSTIIVNQKILHHHKMQKIGKMAVLLMDGTLKTKFLVKMMNKLVALE